jgi:hypothetical protein
MEHLGKVQSSLTVLSSSRCREPNCSAENTALGFRYTAQTVKQNPAVLNLDLAESGQLAQAVAALGQAVALEEAIGHPDLEQDRAFLADLRARLDSTEA